LPGGTSPPGLAETSKGRITMDDSRIANKFRHGLTVKELIECLQDYDPDSYVVFAAGYGDRSRTTPALVSKQALLHQALIVSDVEAIPASRLVESRYSDSGISLSEVTPSEYDYSISFSEYEAIEKVIVLQ
jgi:hypothetical protein